MQILLVAATAMEIEPFLQEKPAADFLVTGVGVAATIFHLTKRVHQLDYDLIIQAGIAGSFDDSCKPGEVVIVKQDNFADLGISEQDNFYSIFEKGFADENEMPFKKGWLVNEGDFINAFPYAKVNAVTINTVSDSRIQKELLVSKFAPRVESMEGAALHYVCLQENIPFLQLRAISNSVGERDKSKWAMKESIQNLNTELAIVYDKMLHGGLIIPRTNL